MSQAASPSSQLLKSQRVLACVRCQQRKVKCDRKFPCANCIKSREQCVPATQLRRKRRFPERELLERLRKYEDLLRQNNIGFNPLHGDSTGEKVYGGYDAGDDAKPSGPGLSSTSATVGSGRVRGPKNFWHAVRQEFRDPGNSSDSSDDQVHEVMFKNTWNQLFQDNDHLLFGSRDAAVDISTLHPEPVQLFRLWQLYLENVNPLLKVTHAPSLQGCIVEAASDIPNIQPALEALMFSIYCVSVLSLAADDCYFLFGSSKGDLLIRYQFGCQQALSNCGFLRTNDRDCLTALYLYLISVRPSTAPQSLSSMLAVAIRIAQRMGIHNEAGLSKCTALEAEMRRRLWWSLMLFDTRISEMADLKTTTLVPTWDCRIPLNVNDSDFSIETKQPVQAQGKTTEALFAVVRSELGDFVRHTRFHLGFTDPALKPVAKDVQSSLNPEDSELASLEEMIEDKYFRFCDPEDPLHYMTIWTTRSYLAKCRLIEHYFRHSNSPAPQKELQRDASISYALTILECDTKIMTSSLTRGFHWLMSAYFPFPAYIHIVQSLKRQQVDGQAEKAWEAMSDNYEARFGSLHPSDNHPFFKVFTKIILQAWEARETASIQTEQTLATPRIVSSIRQKVSDVMPPGSDIGQPGSADMGIKTFPMSMPIGLEAQDNYAASETYPEMPGLDPLDVDLNQLDWSAMDWDLVNLSAGKSTDFWPPS